MFVNFWYFYKFFFFLYYYNWIYFLFTSFWLFILIFFLYSTVFRYKFFLFFVFLICSSIWGFIYNWDGIILVLVLTECVILFIFYLLYTQVYWRINLNTTTYFINISNYFILFIFILNLYFITFFNSSFFTWSNWYISLYYITSSDFFSFYFFFFINYPIIMFSITVLLGLFSIFFIFIYLNLKSIHIASGLKKKSYNFLRKQLTVKQSNFKVYLRSFQN